MFELFAPLFLSYPCRCLLVFPRGSCELPPLAGVDGGGSRRISSQFCWASSARARRHETKLHHHLYFLSERL